MKQPCFTSSEDETTLFCFTSFEDETTLFYSVEDEKTLFYKFRRRNNPVLQV